VCLSLVDLFIVGLALDITGAYLVARGLLLSTTDIAGLGTYAGVGVDVQVDRMEGRIDALSGIVALFVGFGVQGLGYLLTLGGVDVTTGACRVVAGLGLAALSSTAYIWVWRHTRDGRIRRLLVRVVLARKGSGWPGDEQRPGWTYHKAKLLVSYGEGAGYQLLQTEQEHWERYARRVFGECVRPEDINWSREPPPHGTG
jgi:hypothetical protein